jgi:hypothetical protein
MKRYYGASVLFGLFMMSLYGLQPISKKRRCALEPCMDQKISVSSNSFIKNSKIPNKHVYTNCGGTNVSPQLSWQKIEGAKSYIIVVEDPDAPSAAHPNINPYIHWQMFDIPASILNIPEEVSSAKIGALEGKNDFGNTKYDGPCPPTDSGKHRYFFRMFAVNIPTLGLKTGATRAEIFERAEKHIIAVGEVIGTYELP